MKTMRKGLRYFLCYLAMAAVTAVGVILFTPTNAPSNMRPTNPEIETSFITDAITNLTSNENYNINAEINIKQEGSQDIKILLDLNLNARNTFSELDASGTATVVLDGQSLTVGLILIDSDLFLDIDGSKMHFTTNNLMSAVGMITELLGLEPITLPSFDNFDMNMIAAMFEEYQEFEQNGEKSVSFSVFGIDVMLKLDNDYSITEIIIPGIKQGGLSIDLKAELSKLETNQVATPQLASYKDGEYISKLLGCFKNLVKNNFLDFIATVNYGSDINLFSQSIKFNAQVDLKNLQTTVTSNSFGDLLSFTYANEMVYTQFGGIKIKSSVKDLTKLLDLYQSIGSTLGELNIPEINDALSTIDEYLDMLNINIDTGNITLEQITQLIALAYSVDIYDNWFMLEVGSATIHIETSDENISQIIISSDNVSVTLSNIKNTGNLNPVNGSEYLNFNEIYPTLKAAADTANKLTFSGTLYIKNDIRNLEFNYSAKWQNGAPVINLSTVFGGKTINLTYTDSAVYFAIDGIKVYVSSPEDFGGLMRLLSSTFGFEVNLPDINMLTQLYLKDISVQFISEIKPLINGLSILLSDGTRITLNHSGGLLSNISFINGGINACLSINTNNVTFPVIDKNEYINYSIIVEQIGKFIDLARADNLKVSGQFSFNANGTAVAINLITSINIQTYDSVSIVDVIIDGTTYNATLYYSSGVFYVQYGDYKVSVSSGKIEQLLSFVADKLPNYYDYSTLLEPFEEYISLLQNPSTLLDEIPESLSSQIDLFEQYIEKIESITLTNSGNLVLTLNINGQTISVTLGDNIVINAFDSMVSIEQISAFDALPTDNSDYLNADNFIDLLETIEATVSSKTLAFDVAVQYDSYTIEAAIDIDFRDGLKVNITSNSFGSPLNITYINDTIYLVFGEIKISCTLSQLDEILDYAQNELFDTLTNMNLEAIDDLLEQITDTFENTEELTVMEIYNALKAMTFGDIISGAFRDISFELTTSDGKITDINVNTQDAAISAAVASRQPAISAPLNCTNWDDLFPTIKALVNTLANLTVSGTGQISFVYNGSQETFNFDYIISFVDSNLILQLSMQMYGHSIIITLQDGIIFIELDGVKLQATYDDIKELVTYINDKFGTELSIPDQLIDMAKKLSLQDINVSFLQSMTANGSTLTINFDSSTMLQIKNQGGLISEINFVYTDIVATLFISQVGGITIPDIDQASRDGYLRYVELTKYMDEISQLIEDFKNEATDQYQFLGQIGIYEADLNYASETNKARDNYGVSYGASVYDNALSRVLLDIQDLSFELFGPENILLEALHINIAASGRGALYDQWVRYPQTLEAWYYSNPPDPQTSAPGDGHLYLNTNGLKGQMNKSNIREVFETAKFALPHYLDTSGFQEILDAVLFNDNHDMMIDLALASSGMEEMGEEGIDIFGILRNYAPLITSLTMDQTGKISLDLDIGSLLNYQWGENIITIEIQFNGQKLQLDMYGLKVGEGIYMNLTGITVDTIPSIARAPADPGNYMDFSTLANFLGEVDDTIQTSYNASEQSYNMGIASGSYININLNAYNIASCELRLTIQNAEFKLHEDGSFEAMISLTLPGRNVSLFGLIGVQNINEPSNANSNTTNHSVKIYITDRLEGRPMIYVDRTTTYKTGGFLGIGAKNATDYIKARHDPSNMDVFVLIQDICGFTNDIMEQFRADVEYIDGPTKIEKVIKNYTYTQNGSNKEYRVDFDLQQLTLVKMMNPYDSTYYTHFKATTSLKNGKYLLNNLFIDKIRINAKSGSLEAKVDIYGNIAFDQNKYGVAYNFNTMYALNPTSFGNIKYP
ncbi:MAG: hypothetical protein LBN07_00910 [Christensenellaceae bacterium]|jgi:hypothetical protein|nr:hypothetical protein [Christensenellaceae bacterium]